ncbi:MAG: BMP family protein [Fimbriimonadaceae bacterium]
MTLFLIAALALFTIGCSPDQGAAPAATGESGQNEKPLVVGIVFDSGGRGDKSFNDSAWAGIQEAQNELGIQSKPIESKTESDYPSNIELLARQNVDMVIAVGISMRSAMEDVAARYPDMKFAIIDAPVDLPNVRAIQFKEEEGSFLAGYAAGLASKTGKIGFVGGMELPLIKKFEAGYIAGAKTANPNIEVLPARYVGSWDNVDSAKTAANLLYGQGADVVYHAAGRAGLGVIRAAQERNALAIGVDSDQDDIAPGSVLTSMLKRVDNAVLSTIRDLHRGEFTPGTVVYTLEDDGVGLTDFRHTRDRIGEENLKRLDEVRLQIIEGEIQVPSTPAELQEYLESLSS